MHATAIPITGSPNSPARGWSSRGHIATDLPPSPHRSSASWPPVCRTPASAARATGTGEQETRVGFTRQAARLCARLRTDMMRSAAGEGHGEGRPRSGPTSRGWRVHLCRRRHALAVDEDLGGYAPAAAVAPQRGVARDVARPVVAGHAPVVVLGATRRRDALVRHLRSRMWGQKKGF